MGIKPNINPNALECIRCGDCKKICPTGAITSGLKNKPGSINKIKKHKKDKCSKI